MTADFFRKKFASDEPHEEILGPETVRVAGVDGCIYDPDQLRSLKDPDQPRPGSICRGLYEMVPRVELRHLQR